MGMFDGIAGALQGAAGKLTWNRSPEEREARAAMKAADWDARHALTNEQMDEASARYHMARDQLREAQGKAPVNGRPADGIESYEEAESRDQAARLAQAHEAATERAERRPPDYGVADARELEDVLADYQTGRKPQTQHEELWHAEFSERGFPQGSAGRGVTASSGETVNISGQAIGRDATVSQDAAGWQEGRGGQPSDAGARQDPPRQTGRQGDGEDVAHHAGPHLRTGPSYTEPPAGWDGDRGGPYVQNIGGGQVNMRDSAVGPGATVHVTAQEIGPGVYLYDGRQDEPKPDDYHGEREASE